MGLQIRSDSGQVFQARFASTGTTTAKAPHVFNGRVWIPLNTELANASNEFVYRAEISGVAKASGAAWVPGDALYWDDTAKALTKTATNNTLCGHAIEAAGAADTVAPLVHFNTFA